jgi:exonuclease III
MSDNFCCFVWNVRGLNERARRFVVREFVMLHKPSVVCVQETKISALCNTLANEILGPAFDYVVLSAAGSAGGILLAWGRLAWAASYVQLGRFSISAKLSRVGSAGAQWWFTGVYGPHADDEKVQFLAELLQFRATVQGPWLLCGDFNMIYHAQDKNNGRLDRRCMRRFRSFIDQAGLEEINMLGRSYSWSNQRAAPTLELLDKVFATVDWLDEFPSHMLRPLSSDCSDHCSLLLISEPSSAGQRRFHFETFWTKVPGYGDIVKKAWDVPVAEADPFRVLDQKLRNVTVELKRWSNNNIGSIRLQLAVAREIISRFDEEQETRIL